jgi:hypothetical protein
MAELSHRRYDELLGWKDGAMIMGAAPMPSLAERADMLRELALGRYYVADTVMNAYLDVPEARGFSMETFATYLRERLAIQRGGLVFDGLIWLPDEQADFDEEDD